MVVDCWDKHGLIQPSDQFLFEQGGFGRSTVSPGIGNLPSLLNRAAKHDTAILLPFLDQLLGVDVIDNGVWTGSEHSWPIARRLFCGCRLRCGRRVWCRRGLLLGLGRSRQFRLG